MTQEHPVDHVPLKSWISIFGAILGAFMAVLDIQITNSSLDNIVGALGATLYEGSWVATSYLAAEIVIIPVTAWFSTIFSLRRYLLFSAATFLIGSILCAMSWNLSSMILFRVVQGIGGGALIPIAFSIILQTLPMSKRPIGFALFGMTATLAPSIGPTIGGYLTQLFSWEWIFYLNILPGTILLFTTFYTQPKEPMKLSMLEDGDWLGIFFMAVGLSTLTIFLEEGNNLDWFGSQIFSG